MVCQVIKFGGMMFGKSKKTSHNVSIKNLETIIGKSVRIEGDIQVTSGIRIDGLVNGNIIQENGHIATVAIAEGATVNGNIAAGHVIISGIITGSIAADRVEILQTAHIHGDLSYKSIRIETGAKIFGLLDQTDHKSLSHEGEKPVQNSISLLRSEEEKKHKPVAA